MNHPPLNQTQAWMKAVLTVRGDLPQKIHTATELNGLQFENIVKTSPQLSAHRRMDIYAAGYVLRLVDCLTSEYSLLAKFMGEELFEMFAKAFIVSAPSKYWSLCYLGERFEQFLDETKPAFSTSNDTNNNISAEQKALFDLPAQIAKYERAITEVLLAPGMEQMAADSPANASYFFLTGLPAQTKIQTPPCLRTLELDYPILPLIEKLTSEQTYKLPAEKTSYVAITRLNYQLIIKELSPWQYTLLQSCAETVSIEQAALRTSNQLRKHPQTVLGQALNWVPEAIEAGLLTYSM
ncbi:DNA-binding domain-containing protein [Litoribacillus peritrichatus]|uniref:Putative DNA-binding domain-containing protein n=1 Tax=Litoribacillus peritrichatus TaxID=718191 RepID=A0ABP7M6E0_9GAMM